MIEAEQEVELITKSSAHLDSFRDTLGNYIFILGEVSPYPQDIEEIPQADYVVQLTVEEL